MSSIAEGGGESPRALEKEKRGGQHAFISGRRGPRSLEKVTKGENVSKPHFVAKIEIFDLSTRSVRFTRDVPLHL